MNRGNTRALSHHLTKNCSNDSQRVANIHYWITHHIKYDAKRYVRWKTNNQETSNVLRRRKTLCTGYSNLFHDLCTHIGVKSVVVHGYTKNTMVDACDTFYLPDHSWNLVKYNNRWHNADNTWDAGYVEYYKMGPIRSLFSRITFRLVKPIKYKPHFVKAPMNYYLGLPSNNFTVNHLAVNPLLQDFSTTFYSSDFESDSAFYYQQGMLQRTQPISGHDFADLYYSFERTEQSKSDGWHAANLNPKNQYGLAHYYSLELRDHWKDFVEDQKEHAKDSVVLKKLIRMSDSVAHFCRLNDSLLWEEYLDLRAKHRDKRRIQRAYTGSYETYLKRKERRRSMTNDRILRKKNLTKRRKASNEKRYSALLWRHMTSSVRWPKKARETRADLAVEQFNAYADSLKDVRTQMMGLRQRILSWSDTVSAHTNQQAQYIHSVAGHFNGLLFMRIRMVDDYDLPIQKEKSGFIHHSISDSVIRLDFHYKTSLKMFDSLYKLGRQNYRFVRKQYTTLKKVKRSTHRRTMYFALVDQFRKSLQKGKSTEKEALDFSRRELKRLKRINRHSAPTKRAKSYAASEKRVGQPASFYKFKRKKLRRDNQQLSRFARRVHNKSSSHLLRLRLEKSLK